jgi:hypothetical protein
MGSMAPLTVTFTVLLRSSAIRKDPALKDPIAVDAVAALDAAEATELEPDVVPDVDPPVLEIVGTVKVGLVTFGAETFGVVNEG